MTQPSIWSWILDFNLGDWIDGSLDVGLLRKTVIREVIQTPTDNCPTIPQPEPVIVEQKKKARKRVHSVDRDNFQLELQVNNEQNELEEANKKISILEKEITLLSNSLATANLYISSLTTGELSSANIDHSMRLQNAIGDILILKAEIEEEFENMKMNNNNVKKEFPIVEHFTERTTSTSLPVIRNIIGEQSYHSLSDSDMSAPNSPSLSSDPGPGFTSLLLYGESSPII